MLNYLADLFLSEGLFQKAELTIRQALQQTVTEPLFHADNLLILGKILLCQGRENEAVEVEREGLQLIRQEYGRDHPYTIAIEALLQRKRIARSKSA